jgi:hypothetical protein
MRVIALLAALVAAAAVSASARADPSHNIQQPQTLTCDNGTTVVINPGTVTNRSHEGFVVGSNSILVVNYVAFTDATGTFVVVDSAPALSGQTLVTCTGDAGGGFTITVRGFFTPPRSPG